MKRFINITCECCGEFLPEAFYWRYRHVNGIRRGVCRVCECTEQGREIAETLFRPRASDPVPALPSDPPKVKTEPVQLHFL